METTMNAPAVSGAQDDPCPPDWAAVKRDYERGFDPVTVLAVKHGLKPNAIHRMAYHHKWRRLALEGANANAVEVAMGAMTVDLQRALARQLKGLTANMATELRRRNKNAAEKLDTINAAIRSMEGATRVLDKVVSLNKEFGAGLAASRLKNGGDDSRLEFERRLARFAAAANAAAISERAER